MIYNKIIEFEYVTLYWLFVDDCPLALFGMDK